MNITEPLIALTTFFQFLAVLVYLFLVRPIQKKEAQVKDEIFLERRVILRGMDILIFKSVFYSFVAIYRYLTPTLTVPVILVLGVFFVDALVTFVYVLILRFLYTRRFGK